MKLTYILLLIFHNLLLNAQKQNCVYSKCIPFRSSSGVPISQKSMEEMQINPNHFSYESITYNKTNILKIKYILEKIITKKDETFDYFSLRTYFNVDGKKYFIDWDKKHIIYKGDAYKIEKNDLDLLLRLLKSRCR